ncbi:hypothetical protein BB561_004026 [Smittium simulii]|uniref:GHMP kinase C-terminal domain-containing protein n=1 Tax=Smittium simulii TaxID=133385 RepID=A0A2T9YIK3_9FUNG|nr:hypothetical protein BB561_004026 [Smittium simulii]
MPISMPPGFRLILADINAGSNTPSLVRSVLRWKSTDTDSLQLWQQIDLKNKYIYELWEELCGLSTANKSAYNKAIQTASKHPLDSTLSDVNNSDDPDWKHTKEILIKLMLLNQTSNHIRKLMKLMGDKADASIEPDCQTALLDECMECPGVLMAGVPGAGGFDAIYCVCVSNLAAETLVLKLKSLQNKNVTVLPCKQTNSGCTIHNAELLPELTGHFSE